MDVTGGIGHVVAGLNGFHLGGCKLSGQYFQGFIDEVRIYN